MLIIPGLLSREEVLDFRARLQTVPWLDGRNTALGMSADVKRNQQADAANPAVRTLANRLLARYGETPTLVSAALPSFPPASTAMALARPMVCTSTAPSCAFPRAVMSCAATYP